MDRLEAMAILVQAVDAGSLSAAARRLGVPLATVSRNVADLEAKLGAQLLTRSARGLSPTAAGRAYVAAAQAILEDVEEAERTASGEYAAPRGRLVVTAPVVFGRRHVLPAVAEFLDAYPEVDVDLLLSDRVVHLADDHVDAAVRIGDLADSGLVARRVGTVRRVICASPAYVARHGLPASPADLQDHLAIASADTAGPGMLRFGGPDARDWTLPNSRLSVNTVEAAIDAALAGLGLVRVLSYQIAQHVREGALVIALEAFEPPPAPVSLVYGGRSRLPVKLRAFLDLAAPFLKRRLETAML